MAVGEHAGREQRHARADREARRIEGLIARCAALDPVGQRLEAGHVGAAERQAAERPKGERAPETLCEPAKPTDETAATRQNAITIRLGVDAVGQADQDRHAGDVSGIGDAADPADFRVGQPPLGDEGRDQPGSSWSRPSPGPRRRTARRRRCARTACPIGPAAQASRRAAAMKASIWSLVLLKAVTRRTSPPPDRTGRSRPRAALDHRARHLREDLVDLDRMRQTHAGSPASRRPGRAMALAWPARRSHSPPCT